MDMLMFVPLGKVQPNSNRHQRTRQRKLHCCGIAERNDCSQRTDERRGCETGAGARCPEIAQRENE